MGKLPKEGWEKGVRGRKVEVDNREKWKRKTVEAVQELVGLTPLNRTTRKNNMCLPLHPLVRTGILSVTSNDTFLSGTQTSA